MLNNDHFRRDCRYVKEQLTARSDRTGYNAPIMAFDSRRICLMELFTGNSGFYDAANIVKISLKEGNFIHLLITNGINLWKSTPKLLYHHYLQKIL